MGSIANAITRPCAAAVQALARVHRVWWLNVALCVAAGALAARVVASYPPLADPHLPWWAVAVLVAVCERWPVNVQFQRSAHSFSLTDVPITLALVFASGVDALAGVVLGTVIALALRRVPLIKFVFNVAQIALAIAVGLAVVHALAGAGFGVRVWVGVLLGVQVGGVMTILLMAAAMSLSDGLLSPRELRQMFGMDLVVTAANTSFALVAAIMVVRAPEGLPFLLVPVIIAFEGYRAYVREHERHKKVEFLYQANRGLAESPEVAVAIEGLLQHAREAFRADRAELILFGPDGSVPLRTRLGPGDESESLEPVDSEAAFALRELAAQGPVALSHPAPAPVQALAGEHIRNAMAAALHGKERIIGTVLLANRVGLSRGFGDDDLALFETLAANASAALQFDRLEQAVTELRELQHRLHHQAYHDPLTGLANRSLFTQELVDALAGGDGVAVMFIDLDEFKGVNDTLGHAVGDQLLCAAGARIVRSVRDNDLVARLGGDEFAVLVRSAPEKDDATAIQTAERIIKAFELPVAVADRLLSVHMSVGVATGRHSGPTAADLLRDADVAMYEAKSAGKGRYAVFTPGMRDAVVRRHTLRDELEDAIETSRLRLHYQPIVDLGSGRLAAVEALVRWDHPTRGLIPPAEFISLAEESSLVVALGRYVLREACAQAMRWTAAGGAPLSMNVNLSARELEDTTLIPHVAATLADTGLPPERLTLEITETLLVRDAVAGGATLNGLRALGVKLALDDFGTGYSSLGYMRSLPLDILKIAKEFIDGMTRTDDDAAFVRVIAELARVRGLRVVAEGIETVDQLAALRALGCDLGQGYLFSRPLEADDAALSDALGLAHAT